MTQEYKNIGNRGWYRNNNTIATFQIGEGLPMASTDTGDTSHGTPIPAAPLMLSAGGVNILAKGINNMLPMEIKQIFGHDRILPELFDKQYRLLYGKGIFVYKQVFENKKLFRDWQAQETIENWLGDWQRLGVTDSPEQYIEKVIKDSYYFEDYHTKYRFFKGRRLGFMPVGALEHVENRRARLATDKPLSQFMSTYDLIDSDFNHVVLGNWGHGRRDVEVYPRMRMHKAFDFTSAIAYHKHHTPGEIYGMNKFYMGIKEWLIGTARNPAYINSYLENSLSAKIHVIIPHEWVTFIEGQIEGICTHNATLKEEGTELVKINGIDVGTEYHEGLLDAYIKAEMRKLTTFMTGTKNQGKTWTSFKYQTDDGHSSQWEIVPIDMKYKEYIDTLDKHDKRADEVITSAIGIDSAISNISKDGVISKSGADAYYNYIIYLHANLPTAERMVCEDLNAAVNINFPSLYKQGYRIGLYTDIPSRQEDIAPENRLSNEMNGVTQMLHNQQNSINELKTIIQNGLNH
jgi:hypothetical protein